MQIQRESYVIPVSTAGEQYTEFHMEFRTPFGPEKMIVSIVGQQDPRSVVKAMQILGDPEFIAKTWADITGKKPDDVACPLAVMDSIEAIGRTAPEVPFSRGSYEPPF